MRREDHRPLSRVVIVKMWALGDVLIATPMLAALRERFPEIRITWVVDESHGEILRGHPGIDDLEIIHSGRWRRSLRKGNLPGWLAESVRLRRMVARYRPDAVINCHPDKWWTVFLCPAPRRIAPYPSPTLPWSARFYTDPIATPVPAIHATRQYLLATQALGCPDGDLRLTIGETSDEADFLTRFQQRQGIGSDEPVVILAPFTTAENKCWEPERFAELADTLASRFPAQFVMTLHPKDEPAARKIAARANTPIRIAAGTTLRQYVALLRRASVVVSGDTSSLHIAAALGTPYVSLFGPTDPDLLAPLAPRERGGTVLTAPIPCRPCHSTRCSNPTFRECLKAISVEEVARAAGRYLSVSARQELPVHVG
ncbi:MAG: glycosyltransferase family 9 protein [Capsulimonadales bacterium]|nr:glycosyltransferase family 9 protein [Capsulimonadales bacterium]